MPIQGSFSTPTAAPPVHVSAPPPAAPPPAEPAAAPAPAATPPAAAVATPPASPAAAPVATPAPADAAPASPAAEPAKPAAQATEKPPEKPQSPDAWRFAAIAKKEKAARELHDQVKTEAAKLKAEREAIDKAKADQAARSALYRTNPLAALEDAGLSFEQVQQYVLNNQNLTPQQAAQIAIDTAKQTEERIARLRQEQAEELQRRDKAQAEALAKSEAQRAEAAKAAFQDEIRGVVGAEAESFEMVAIAGEQAVQAIYDRIDQHYRETGKVMSIKAAAEQVESGLVAEAERVLGASKKLRAKLTPTPPVTPTPPAAPPPVSRTLSNRMTTAPAPRSAAARDSEAERAARVKAEIERSWGRR